MCSLQFCGWRKGGAKETWKGISWGDQEVVEGEDLPKMGHGHKTRAPDIPHGAVGLSNLATHGLSVLPTSCACYTLTCTHTAEGTCGTQQPCCRLTASSDQIWRHQEMLNECRQCSAWGMTSQQRHRRDKWDVPARGRSCLGFVLLSWCSSWLVTPGRKAPALQSVLRARQPGCSAPWCGGTGVCVTCGAVSPLSVPPDSVSEKGN